MKGHSQGYSVAVMLNCLSSPHFQKEKKGYTVALISYKIGRKICIKDSFSDSWASRVVRPQLMDFSQHIKDYLLNFYR